MRYGLYFTPAADHALSQAANTWLGRDPRGTAVVLDASLPPEHADHVASAARYGFHATLKAPFRLAAGRSENDLCRAADAFCRERAPVVLGCFVPAWIGPFLALVPDTPSGELKALAADIVQEFEPFRASLTTDDLARRRASGLTPRQDEHLVKWGYPYVFDEFRFHMTLTGPVEEGSRAAIENRASSHFAATIAEPQHIDRLVIFREPAAGEPFTVLHDMPFEGCDAAQTQEVLS